MITLFMPDSSPADALAPLMAHITETLRRVERIEYEFASGEQPPDPFELQLWFGDRLVRLRGAGDGERLEVHTVAWQDPFGDAAENERLVLSGRVVCRNVSSDPGYADIVGTALLGVKPRLEPADRLTGVSLQFAANVLHVHIEFDEFFVTWGGTMPPLGSEF